jgi:2-polyprenyl-3-methyl-5-hydroxy-6-metoxy-1,4-benzoquinol methylase
MNQMTTSAITQCPACHSKNLEVVMTDGYDDRHGYPGFFEILKCCNCVHFFINHRFSDSELVTLYTQYYPRSNLKLEDIKPAVLVGGLNGWLVGEKANAYAWIPAKSKVLDVGCGFGESLLYYKNQGCDAYGIDADQNILRVGEHYSLKVKSGLLTPEVFQGEKFDYITLNQVIEHVTDLDTTLQTLRSYLKDDGKIVLTTPNANSFLKTVFGRKWINWHIPYHLQLFSENSFKKALARNGLVLEKSVQVTPSAWLLFQALHLINYPKPGQPSEIWNNKKGVGSKYLLNVAAKIYHRTRLNHLLARFLDALGVGDNTIYIVSIRDI